MPPAARVSDMHTCPLVTGTVPHVGGPILAGHATTIIGGMPAARIGDVLTCVGPPDTIIKGSPTVIIGGMPAARMGDNTAHGGVITLGHMTTLIGDSGGGGGGGAGGAADSAATTSPADTESSTQSEGASTSGAVAPREVEGRPVAIRAGSNTIVCRAGRLVVQNNNSGPDRACTQAHENSHVRDWKNRYGGDLCEGVSDGQLPTGGPGYAEFLRQSECRAFRTGKQCRENLLRTANDEDQAAIQRSIDRDNTQLRTNRCG